MKRVKKLAGKYLLSVLAIFLTANFISAAPVIRLSSGANPVAIQPAVDVFKIDLGGQLNPNTAETFSNGRREITWDDVPDSQSLPFALFYSYFNTISPRGVVLTSPASSSPNDVTNLMVSADADSGTTVRFGNIDPSYDNVFRTFSSERLFAPRGQNGQDTAMMIDVNFFIPGTNIPATVSGFGVVFADVDNLAMVRVYGANGRQMTDTLSALPANNGLSFVGVSFNAGERISRVEIRCGRNSLLAGNVDGINGVEVVAMDDMIYGEPRAAEFHPGDFDGDGASDSAIYRPNNGTWYILNSGTSTLRIAQWGAQGDVPLSGDFDGDALGDLAVFRPSNGVWFINSSSNGAILGRQFGQNGDKPVVSDYDQDRRSDIAIWRPSDGNFYVSGSIDNFTNFYAYPFGTNGDIPVGALN